MTNITDNGNNKDRIFLQWFVGFSDAKASFNIVPKLNIDIIVRFTFMFVIRLHVDDKNTLICIQAKLNTGHVRVYKNECVFVIYSKEGIKKLTNIFDTHTLNTFKYLNYLDFKKAFTLYNNREGSLTEELKGRILELK